MIHSALKWKTRLPLTFGEREGRKETAIVRASVRIAVFRQRNGHSECLFIAHPVKGLEVPGGAVDPDELPLDAALRELSEEAGLEIDGADDPVELAGFVPITDQQDGRWLDIVYVVQISEAKSRAENESKAEFPISWLNVNHLTQHLSSNAQQIVNCALKHIGLL